MSNWTEHRNPEGRTYWFNTSTRQSVWEKPDELKTPFERALNQTKWKEYFSGGRKYYYNTESKESKWDMPDELLLLLEKVEKENGAAAAPVNAANNALPAPENANGSATPEQGNLQVGAHTGGPAAVQNQNQSKVAPNLGDEPVIPHNGYATYEEGEKAFIYLLRKAGADPSWTWEQTMRATITDPLYRALNSLAEKKAVFEKHIASLKAKEQEEKEARLNKLRPAIRNMLKGNPNVFHYTTFATADRVFHHHPIWQQARIEAERRLIFDQYVGELKQREVQESRAARTRSVGKLVNLLKELEVDVLTRWRTAHSLILQSEEWNTDSELRKLPTLDILLAFEDYSRLMEREYEERTRRAQVEKTRKERKAREAFKGLLQELVDSGKIVARTKWKEVYPLLKDDERYLNMLGIPGSNQLELFWDVVDGLDQKLDQKIAVVQDAITKNGSEEQVYTVTPETSEEEFFNTVKGYKDEAVEKLGEEELRQVFTTMKNVALKKQADDKRRAERKQRHLQDDLRYALKKLPEQLDINLSYEEAVSKFEHLPEYKAIEDDESRRVAFAKYVKRAKERMRDAASEDGSASGRKRKEPYRDDRDYDRDRDRDRDPKRDREYKKDYERGTKHHRHDDYRYERDSRDGREGYSSRSSKHYRDRDSDRKPSKPEHTREWDDAQRRDRSVSSQTPREKRDGYDERDKLADDRTDKRARTEREDKPGTPAAEEKEPPPREETPEEGEI